MIYLLVIQIFIDNVFTVHFLLLYICVIGIIGMYTILTCWSPCWKCGDLWCQNGFWPTFLQLSFILSYKWKLKTGIRWQIWWQSILGFIHGCRWWVWAADCFCKAFEFLLQFILYLGPDSYNILRYFHNSQTIYDWRRDVFNQQNHQKTIIHLSIFTQKQISWHILCWQSLAYGDLVLENNGPSVASQWNYDSNLEQPSTDGKCITKMTQKKFTAVIIAFLAGTERSFNCHCCNSSNIVQLRGSFQWIREKPTGRDNDLLLMLSPQII